MQTRVQARNTAVLNAVRDAGAAGAATTDAPGVLVREFQAATRILVAEQLVFMGALGHRTRRYFLRPEWAIDFERRRRVAVKGPEPRGRARASWPADAPIHYPKNPDGTDAFKFTRIETPKPPPDMPIRTTHCVPY